MTQRFHIKSSGKLRTGIDNHSHLRYNEQVNRDKVNILTEVGIETFLIDSNPSTSNPRRCYSE